MSVITLKDRSQARNPNPKTQTHGSDVTVGLSVGYKVGNGVGLAEIEGLFVGCVDMEGNWDGNWDGSVEIEGLSVGVSDGLADGISDG